VPEIANYLINCFHCPPLTTVGGVKLMYSGLPSVRPCVR